MDERNNLSYFFLGLGVGVAAGLLFAPKAGTDTRDLLKNKVDESGDYLKRKGTEWMDLSNQYVDQGKEVLGRQKEQVAAAIDAGKQAYRETISGTETT